MPSRRGSPGSLPHSLGVRHSASSQLSLRQAARSLLPLARSSAGSTNDQEESLSRGGTFRALRWPRPSLHLKGPQRLRPGWGGGEAAGGVRGGRQKPGLLLPGSGAGAGCAWQLRRSLYWQDCRKKSLTRRETNHNISFSGFPPPLLARQPPIECPGEPQPPSRSKTGEPLIFVALPTHPTLIIPSSQTET